MNENKTIVPDADALLALGRLKHVNLASNAEAKEVRASVPPGEHTGSVTLQLDYSIKVGEEHEAMVSQSVPWKQLAGFLFGKLNATTREAVIREALQPADGGGFEFKELAANKAGEDAIAALMGETMKTVAGKVTGKATLTEVLD